jgi:serine phosphatase RsbU (regulator of sigma subunit)
VNGADTIMTKTYKTAITLSKADWDLLRRVSALYGRSGREQIENTLRIEISWWREDQKLQAALAAAEHVPDDEDSEEVLG